MVQSYFDLGFGKIVKIAPEDQGSGNVVTGKQANVFAQINFFPVQMKNERWEWVDMQL